MAAIRSKNLTRQDTGFTIVELLIVIVIIGILAALVIVAYTGIQQRADNAKTAAAIEAYQKALIAYVTDKGTYPIANAGACLGQGNPNGACYAGQYTEANSVAFTNNLRPYFNGGALPVPNTKVIGGANGALFYHSASGLTIDGQPHASYIWYVVEGTGTRCPVGSVLGGDYPTWTSNPPSGHSASTISGGEQCWISLPDPGTL